MFGIFWNFQKMFGIFRNFQKCLEFFGIFKKSFGIFQNFQKIFGFFGIFKKSFGIFWNFQKSFGFFRNFQKNVWKCFGIFFATEQSPLPHDGAERPRRHSKKAPTSTSLGSKQRQKVARVATSGSEIDQNSEKRFFLIFKDFKIFIAREARTPISLFCLILLYLLLFWIVLKPFLISLTIRW